MVTRLALFFSSYALLFVLLAIRFTEPAAVAVCAALAILGFACAAWVLWIQREKGARKLDVSDVTESGGEVSGYLLSYVVPFVVTSADVRTVAGLVLLFAVIALIYIRSNMIQINPTFYLLGYHVGQVKLGDGRTAFLIFRGELVSGERINAVLLTNRVYKQVPV